MQHLPTIGGYGDAEGDGDREYWVKRLEYVERARRLLNQQADELQRKCDAIKQHLSDD